MLNLENCDEIIKDFFLKIDGVRDFERVSLEENSVGIYKNFAFCLHSIHKLKVSVRIEGSVSCSIMKNIESEEFKEYISLNQLFYNEDWYKNAIRNYEKERDEKGDKFTFEDNLKAHFDFLKQMLEANKDIQEIFYGRKWIEQKHHFEYIENFYNEIRQNN
jgi:hypothetical protein